MSTPSTASVPLPNRFVSPWVLTILFSMDIMPTSFVICRRKFALQFGRIGARPKPGSELCRVEAGNLPGSRYRNHGTVHGGRSAVKGADGAAFQGSRADEAQRDSLILPLDYREQRDGGADTGERHDHLQDGADDDAGIRAMPEDVVRSAQRIVEKEGRDRDEAEQVERAGGKRGLSKWTHLKLLV